MTATSATRCSSVVSVTGAPSRCVRGSGIDVLPVGDVEVVLGGADLDEERLRSLQQLDALGGERFGRIVRQLALDFRNDRPIDAEDRLLSVVVRVRIGGDA